VDSGVQEMIQARAVIKSKGSTNDFSIFRFVRCSSSRSHSVRANSYNNCPGRLLISGWVRVEKSAPAFRNQGFDAIPSNLARPRSTYSQLSGGLAMCVTSLHQG
jgi:hypothetical protein